MIMLSVIVIYGHITLSPETLHLPSSNTLPRACQRSRRGHPRQCQTLRTQQMSLLLRRQLISGSLLTLPLLPTCKVKLTRPFQKLAKTWKRNHLPMTFLCAQYLMAIEVNNKFAPSFHAHLLTVIPEDWLMKHNLITKRIYVHVRNTDPQLVYGDHFANGFYEGERGMIMEHQDDRQVRYHSRIRVAVKQRWVTMPSRHLFYEMPTSKGQPVVVISDDHAGEVYVTREPDANKVFPLVRRGKGNRLTPVCFVEQRRLARCDVS
jgi:hypothetical protein